MPSKGAPDETRAREPLAAKAGQPPGHPRGAAHPLLGAGPGHRFDDGSSRRGRGCASVSPPRASAIRGAAAAESPPSHRERDRRRHGPMKPRPFIIHQHPRGARTQLTRARASHIPAARHARGRGSDLRPVPDRGRQNRCLCGPTSCRGSINRDLDAREGRRVLGHRPGRGRLVLWVVLVLAHIVGRRVLRGARALGEARGCASSVGDREIVVGADPPIPLPNRVGVLRWTVAGLAA